MTLQLSAINPKVTLQNGKAITTSQDVANYFGKLHKDVLRKIESLECSIEFTSANFYAHVQKIDIGNGAARESKIYHMTKDGFVFLVMGFTGKKAAAFKEAYISEFNRIEAQLHNSISVTGTANKILLTLLPNGKVDSARVVHDNEYVSSLDTLFEIGRRSGYVIIHKDELIKKLSE